MRSNPAVPLQPSTVEATLSREQTLFPPVTEETSNSRSPRQLLLYLARRHPSLIVLNIVLGFSGALFNGISTALIMPVLLSFLGQPIPLKGDAPILKLLLFPLQSGDRPHVGLMIGVILVLLLLKNLAGYGNALVAGSMKRILTNDLRERGLRLLLEVDLDFYSRTSVGDLLNRLNNEVSRAAGAISSVTRSITVLITVLVFVGLLLSLSWQLTLISTALLAIVALVNQFSIRQAKSLGKQLSETSKQYSSNILEVLSGMRLVRTTASEAAAYHKIIHLIRAREQAEFRSQAVAALIDPVNEMAGVMALLLIVAIGSTFMARQMESFSAILLTYLFLLFRTLPLIGQLNNARSQFANISPSLEIACEFLRRDNKPFMQNGTLPFQSLQTGIQLCHVSFTYPGREKQVLQDITLNVPCHKTLAIVGASGSGKSTLVDLLPRLSDPTKGYILLDGRDLREFDYRSLRRAMGIVSQETFLFHASVRENIAYGNPQATDEEIIAAAKQANAYEFIVQLPQGFETLIGDRGVLLSGGQRQRIAIARALLQNPPILILDEATSALDTVSEKLVQEAIDRLSRDRTTIIIAHRLSTVQKADQIAVLDQGRLVELGTHQSLLAKQGYYARLCEMQFADQFPEEFTKKFPEQLAEQSAGQSTEHLTTPFTRNFSSAFIDRFVGSEEIDRQRIGQISYQMRSLFSTLIGSLTLIVDDIVQAPEEQQEYIETAYRSALKLVNYLEAIEELS
ncbi:ABC transporter ATP-binding protein [Leptolyngbya ohadii]|uniref:ABC transporter ATP-binding protein n=1 Tax=Leptolyngbya ohadii TaxID=1962290 RepID=UPI000B59A024|nr:ABC transporter ATP-binding protein [Leptolyngbya ohadii]